jgi:hypothetical protein
MTINWNFPTNDYGERKGISDSGVETFRGRPIKSLAREICQNSLDAGLPGERVEIEFSNYSIDASEFPNKHELIDAMKKSIYSWRHESSGKTKEFMSNAINILNKRKIEFLRVSDFHTKGLLGSNTSDASDFNNLVKSSGSSDKNAEAGGSFGIGKFAPFVCSELRTVFYSTLDIKGIVGTQGVSRLVSFKKFEDSDIETQGIGYYGNTEKNTCIQELKSFDPEFKRDTTGTDIYIAGFKEFEDWEADIIKEILDGFLYAIYMDTLFIRVNDIILSKETLETVIRKYRDSLNINIIKYYETLESSETKWIITDFENMGKIKLGLLLLKDNAPRKVAMIRKPWMKIKDQASINGSVPFVGVLIIEGTELNEFLRKIENPQHTLWEPRRYVEKRKVSAARNVLRKMKSFIIDELNKMIVNDGIDELDLPGAGEFFPMEDDGEKKDKDHDELSPVIVKAEPKKRKIKVKRPKSETVTEEEYEDLVRGGVINEGDEIPIRGTGKRKKGNHEGNKGSVGQEEGDFERKIKVTPINLRLISTNKSINEYTLMFLSPTQNDDTTITINRLDEQGNKAPVLIKTASQNGNKLEVDNNKIVGASISCNRMNVIQFNVNMDEYFSGEVLIHGNKR